MQHREKSIQKLTNVFEEHYNKINVNSLYYKNQDESMDENSYIHNIKESYHLDSNQYPKRTSPLELVSHFKKEIEVFNIQDIIEKEKSLNVNFESYVIHHYSDDNLNKIENKQLCRTEKFIASLKLKNKYTEYQTGEKVLLYRSYSKNKFSDNIMFKWEGPFEVINRLGRFHYCLKCEDRFFISHILKIRKYDKN